MDFEAYNWRIGRWSQKVGAAFVGWLARPPGLRWLDVGCGSGALSRAIIEFGAARHVVATDPSAAAVAAASAAIDDPHVDFQQAGAEQLPFAAAAFDVVVSGLALNFIRDLGTGMREMSRVVVAGGFLAGYVWDFDDGMQVLRRFWDAAGEFDPAARVLDPAALYPMCRREPLHRLFTDSGLSAVEVRALETSASFPDFETYWRALSAPDAAPGEYLLSLSAAGREVIRERILATLPLRADGSFGLVARAWAARGTTA